MSRSVAQFFLLVLLSAFCLFLGIDIASRNGADASRSAAGPDREVFRPMPVFPEPTPVADERYRFSTAEPFEDHSCGARSVLCPKSRSERDREPTIARIGNGIGDLFHRTAYHAVDGVTSLLSRLTD
ncbi:MAG: hypothetical protein BLM47_09000 [Candidatus Reconcilbacillus cellulovorans]|uniref:Uncharacterized protein n=1 Tax=Candidatus Reconcilbacillus cellulovorans TaxID=1906605 RepID=A0A2A6DYU4_9BACL|nr:MAG: hypothetical protein BLM47_09000 [Candidatus Reconcilbacillus cellulovorans]